MRSNVCVTQETKKRQNAKMAKTKKHPFEPCVRFERHKA